MTQPSDPRDIDQRRSAARRTALWFGLVAVAVYAVFILGTAFGTFGK